MAAKGKTLANSGFESEVKSIQAFLSMQHPASQPVINPQTLDIQIEDYVAQRFLKKPKSKVNKQDRGNFQGCWQKALLKEILLVYLLLCISTSFRVLHTLKAGQVTFLAPQ